MGLRDVRKLLRREAAHPAAGDAKPSNFDAETATTTRLFSKLRQRKHEKLEKKAQSRLPPDKIVCKGTECGTEEPSPEPQPGQRPSTSNPTKIDAKCPAVDTCAADSPSYKPSLWDRAYDTLRKDNAQLLEEYETLVSREVQSSESRKSPEPTTPLPNDSPRLRRLQLDKIIDQGLRRTDGRVAGCVDSSALASTAEFLSSIKGFITQAVSASPEASVAWAAVCLVLPLLTNHVDAEEANREGFTYTIHRMDHYSALEPLVFERDGHLNPFLRAAIEKRFETLYSTLLEFQIRTALRLHERTAKTFVKETFNPNAWKELQANIEKAEALLNQDLEQVTSSALLLEAKKRNDLSKQHAANLEKLLLPLRDTTTKIANTTEKQLHTEHEILAAVTEQSKFQQAEAQRKDKQKMSDEEIKCLAYLRLTVTDTYETTKDRVEDHVEGTCHWVVRQPSFCQWMEQDSGPLLITADPGCGKSVLTKYLVDHHLPRKSATICYFFFKEPHQTKIHQALCAILHQLFTKSPTLLKKHAMDRLLKDHKGLVNTPSSLWTIFWQAVCDPEAGPITVVMDALDECDPSDLEHFLIPYLRKSMAKSVNAKFLFTTRPYKSITSQFGRLKDSVPSYVRILGEDQCEDISKEVNLVIEHRVEEFAKENEIHIDLKRKLRNMLLAIEHRTYLWVALLFDDLRYQSLKKTTDGIEAAIRTLPTTVNEAYEKLLSRSTEHSTVRRALSFIIAAERPLTVAEMKVALNVRAGILPKDDHESEDDFRGRLRQLCGLFVSFYKDKVYFFHQTAREFLLSHPQAENSVLLCQDNVDTQWRSSISIPQAHVELAHACAQYLYMLRRDGFYDLHHKFRELDTIPFHMYAATSWRSHYRLSNGNVDEDAEFRTAAVSICDPRATGFDYIIALRYSYVLCSREMFSTPLRVASYLNINAAVQDLLATGIDMEIEQHGGGGEWPAVQIAAAHGCYDIALLLLSHLPPNATERMGAQPIERMYSPGWSPFGPHSLHYPHQDLADNDQSGYERMLLFLLNNRLLNQPWKEDWPGCALLEGLAHWGYNDYIDMVLKKCEGHTIEQRLHDIALAVYRAVGAGQKQTINMLLDYGDDIVEASSAESDKPLDTVGFRGSHVILRTRIKNGRTSAHLALKMALEMALERGASELLQLLIGRGACVEEVDCIGGRGLLHYLVDGRSSDVSEIVQLSLNRGADINAAVSLRYPDRRYRGKTPLHCAVRSTSWNERTVRLLLDKGADLKAAGLLLENGAELESTFNFGRTALHMASYRSNENMSLMLIDKGANIKATDEWGWTPLHAASGSERLHSGQKDVIRVLLYFGADIEARDIRGMTPLCTAVLVGHLGIANFLLDSGADLMIIFEAFDAIFTHTITSWLSIVSTKRHFVLQYEGAEALGSLCWWFQKSALIQHPTMSFQILLDQFCRDHVDEVFDLLQHYDYFISVRELALSRLSRFHLTRIKYVLDTYTLLFQSFTQHGINLKEIEERAWKECGVAVPSYWLYGEDMRFYNFDDAQR
ncbi:ankyrin repeat-containing domain protein [Copromyces sp. CBS 386.78]|nr:ankyrin repeat-containing domain protein [Copromyces sp. CBS 386.78]